jgi:hypothetical protein
MSEFILAFDKGALVLGDFEDERRFKELHRISIAIEMSGSIAICIMSYFLYKESRKRWGKAKSILFTFATACILFVFINRLPAVKEHIRLAKMLEKKYNPLYDLIPTSGTIRKLFG